MRVAEELHGPVVPQRADGQYGRAVLMGFPHFDRRAHRGLGHEGDQGVDFAAHPVVAEEDVAAPFRRAGRFAMVGKRVVDLGLGKMLFQQTA